MFEVCAVVAIRHDSASGSFLLQFESKFIVGISKVSVLVLKFVTLLSIFLLMDLKFSLGLIEKDLQFLDRSEESVYFRVFHFQRFRLTNWFSSWVLKSAKKHTDERNARLATITSTTGLLDLRWPFWLSATRYVSMLQMSPMGGVMFRITRNVPDERHHFRGP